MTVKYNIVERGNPANPNAPKKFHPSVHSTGRVTTRDLVECASQMSTLTSTDLMAAMESFLTIIPDELAKGNIVELGEFGSFCLWITSEGAETAAEVRGEQILTIMLRFMPGKLFKSVIERIQLNKNQGRHSFHGEFNTRRSPIKAVTVYFFAHLAGMYCLLPNDVLSCRDS